MSAKISSQGHQSVYFELIVHLLMLVIIALFCIITHTGQSFTVNLIYCCYVEE